MQQTRFCSEILLVMSSHHRLMHFHWNSPVTRRDLARLASRKKFVSIPWTNRAFQCGFSTFYLYFCGRGGLSQGKEGQREKLEVKREP